MLFVAEVVEALCVADKVDYFVLGFGGYVVGGYGEGAHW